MVADPTAVRQIRQRGGAEESDPDGSGGGATNPATRGVGEVGDGRGQPDPIAVARLLACSLHDQGKKANKVRRRHEEGEGEALEPMWGRGMREGLSGHALS